MDAQSTRGSRTIAAKDYFAGIMTTALEEDELLVEARLPILPADTRVGFCEFSRRAGDFALGMAAVAYRTRDGCIIEPRVGVGGAEPYARRIAEAEAAMDGQKPGPAAFQAAAEIAAATVEPLEDINTSADYRRDLVRAMTRRALDRAAA
jgi:carbon-monoxide dehydrogenase medium subunit